MNKQHFALKLLPCRPSFAFDMTEAEKAVMQEHVVYLMGLMKQGILRVFGPVMDSNAPYGFAIAEVESEEQVKDIIANDPASSLNRYEYYPMRAVFPDTQLPG